MLIHDGAIPETRRRGPDEPDMWSTCSPVQWPALHNRIVQTKRTVVFAPSAFAGDWQQLLAGLTVNSMRCIHAAQQHVCRSARRAL